MLRLILSLLLGIGLGFIINAGLVWVICWGLKAIGITTIGSWTVAFSWPLVIVFTAIYYVIYGIFHDIKK